ncbi:MAG: glutamine--fructose-6-phosphate transaminase (isomerizing) [Methanobacteriota archaeon]
MCGIVGYTGDREAQGLLLKALKRLEYRGYDSAGVAIIGERLTVYKDKGEISRMESSMPAIRGTHGIAHTRWATHGQPLKNNAHPFVDCKERIALVHNGIIENFMSLKEELMRKGHQFRSETDTEVIVHLIEDAYEGNLEGAVAVAVKRLKGSYAIAVVHEGEKGKIVAVRHESPLIVGLGTGETFLASDIPAVLDLTDRIIPMMDGEMAVLTPQGVQLRTIDGEAVQRDYQRVKYTVQDAELGGYQHFMLKEIFEQPRALHQTLLGRLSDRPEQDMGVRFDSVKLVACGTSYHACYVGKYVFETVLKIPTTAEIASEYRYSTPSREMPLTILVTQSGETADTLAAAREAKRRGCYTIGITNVVGSTITREVDEVYYTRAGIEIGVAATKTFVTQLAVMYLLAIKYGALRRVLHSDTQAQMRDALRSMPQVVQSVLNNSEKIEAVAKEIAGARDMFFIGRNLNYPVVLEGALKMKEISYIHAEGYAAGELKHGPLALLTKDTPVVAVAVPDHTYEKVLSNIGEVSAREAPVVCVGIEGDSDLEKYCDNVIYVPKVPPLFSAIPVSVALQLLSYYVARERGCPIDKPRNLAKSVTVE